jgi:hypothetical protein
MLKAGTFVPGQLLLEIRPAGSYLGRAGVRYARTIGSAIEQKVKRPTITDDHQS